MPWPPTVAAAGALTHDAEAIGVHAVVIGMDSNEAQRAMNVRHDLAHDEFGLGTVANREEGMPSVQEWLGDAGNERSRIHQVDTGLETTADDEDHATAVLFRRLPDIHRQGHSEFAFIDNITYPLLCAGAVCSREHAQCQDGQSRSSNSKHDTHFLSAAERVMRLRLRDRSRCFSGRIFNPRTTVRSTSTEPGHSVPRVSAAAAHRSAPQGPLKPTWLGGNRSPRWISSAPGLR